ncbi:hypothetical protein IGJ22_001148 [Enterococcus sp. DIV0448]
MQKNGLTYLIMKRKTSSEFKERKPIGKLSQ